VDVLPNYSLEVSSPGLKRLLRNGGEFARFPGAPVKMVYDEGPNRKVAKGTIKSVSDGAVTVSSETGEITITYGAIINANLDY
jgi:ribosome maturation factor RimP